MNCPNCGNFNNQGSKFCINCGNVLNTNSSNDTTAAEFQNQSYQQPINNQQMVNQSYQQPVVQPQANIGGTAVFNFFMYIIFVLIKPFENFKNNESKLCKTKNSLILGGIVAGAMVVINLIKSMISVVFTKAFDYSTFKYKTVFQIENLKNLDYLSLIFKNLLIYAAIIVVIALVYYLASLVAKKQVSFIKFLSISITSIIPYVLVGMVVAPILGKIWVVLSFVCMIVSILYSIIIFISLINEEIKFEKKDSLIYFHLICISMLVVSMLLVYYLFIYVVAGGILGQISGLIGN